MTKEKTASHTRYPTLHVEQVETVTEFEGLKPHWNALLNRCKRPEIYLTYEWMSSWWRSSGKNGKRLCILVVRSEHEIVGIAPLMELSERFFGLPMTTIKFISMTDFADSPTNCAASLDMIIPELHEEVVAAIMDHLSKHNTGWNVVRLNPFPESSKTLQVLENAAIKKRFRTKKYVVYVNAFIDVTTDWQQYVSKLSPRFTKSLRTQERRLQQQGEITYQEFNVNGNADKFYDEIIDIEKRSWKWDIGISINSVVFGNFYKVFAQEAAKQGWLRVWMMQVNGRNIAYDYIIDYRGQLVSLKTSYDNEYRNYGPGNLLTLREFQRFFETGTKQISLMWGDINVKQRWGAALEEHYEIYFFNKGFYSNLLHFFYITCSLAQYRRLGATWKNRIARKLGLRLKHSELTRLDQLNDHNENV